MSSQCSWEKIFLVFYNIQFSASTIESPLQMVQIYFDTATFDQIDRDVKITTVAALGLIGGTMGLLTGFSILSGVEIVYFVLKFFMSLRIQKKKK